MARSITQIQADIDAVHGRLANPEEEVRLEDGTVRYRSIADNLMSLSALQVELDSANSAAANTTRPRQIRLSGSSGFGC